MFHWFERFYCHFLISLLNFLTYRTSDLELWWIINLSSFRRKLRYLLAPGSNLQGSFPSWKSHSCVVRDLQVWWNSFGNQSPQGLQWSCKDGCRWRTMVWNWTRVYSVGHWWSPIGMATQWLPSSSRVISKDFIEASCHYLIKTSTVDLTIAVSVLTKSLQEMSLTLTTVLACTPVSWFAEQMLRWVIFMELVSSYDDRNGIVCFVSSSWVLRNWKLFPFYKLLKR